MTQNAAFTTTTADFIQPTTGSDVSVAVVSSDSGGARRGWQVTGAPDLTGALYSTSINTGPRGGSTPFINVSIGTSWYV